MIDTNYLAQIYTNALNSQGTQLPAPRPGGFREMIMKNNGLEVPGTSKPEDVSSPGKDMTLEEYKQYLYKQISQIPIHPTRSQESRSITITDAGFQALKNDPSYEAWVLNDIKTSWAQPDQWAASCGGSFSTLRYGAIREERRASSWYPNGLDGSAERIFQVSSQDSFWKTRGQTRPAGQQQASLRTLLEQKNGQQGNHQTNGQPSSDMLGLLGAMGMFGSFGSFGSLGSLGSSGSLGAGGLGQFFEYLMWK